MRRRDRTMKCWTRIKRKYNQWLFKRYGFGESLSIPLIFKMIPLWSPSLYTYEGGKQICKWFEEGFRSALAMKTNKSCSNCVYRKGWVDAQSCPLYMINKCDPKSLKMWEQEIDYDRPGFLSQTMNIPVKPEERRR